MPHDYDTFLKCPEIKGELPREAGDGVCMELKPKGMHERRKARLRYTVARGWERKVNGDWVPEK